MKLKRGDIIRFGDSPQLLIVGGLHSLGNEHSIIQLTVWPTDYPEALIKHVACDDIVEYEDRKAD